MVMLKDLPDPFVTMLSAPVGESPHQTFNCRNQEQLAPAHRIEQGGIGFSADEPIGTEHVGNCVAVIARDPTTGKTGLAHYDALSTQESLQSLFDRLPEGNLDVVIIGAMYHENAMGNDYLQKTSASNLDDVLHFLSSKNVNIIGVRISDPQQPTNFIVDPKDFSFHPVSPNIPNSDKDLAFARKFLTGQKQPLTIEFDMTESKERFPYFLDETQVQNINDHVKGKSFAEVAAWHRSLGARGGFEDVQANLSLECYLPAYERAIDSLIRDHGTTESMVRSQPIYVGENADLANARLVEPAEINSLDKPSVDPAYPVTYFKL